jgi:hypothetical protein
LTVFAGVDWIENRLVMTGVIAQQEIGLYFPRRRAYAEKSTG